MKKFALVFFSVFLFISTPFHANANIVTATSKYLINAVKHVPNAAKVSATNTATGTKHVVTHGVSAPALGGAIGTGIVGSLVGGGVGIAFQVITGLALDAVDWVMDEENNRIKYKDTNDGGATDGGATGQYTWGGQIGGNYATAVEAAASNCRFFSKSLPATVVLDSDGKNGQVFCDGSPSGGVKRYDNPYYKPPTGGSGSNSDYKSIPLDVLAQKIIDLANQGNAACQSDIENYVTDLAKKGALDAELDAATDITKPDDPEKDPDKDKDCPLGTTKVDDVCIKPSGDDAPLFCNSGDFTRKVCDWIDWTQEKPTESVEKPIEVKEVKADNSNKINMSGECPAPYELNFNVLGYAQNHSISYQPLCNALVMLKPIFVGSGALSGMFLLMGYSRASNTGVNG